MTGDPSAPSPERLPTPLPALVSGLSAFTLTPIHDGRVDAVAVILIIERLAGAGADSIGVLRSTGSSAYLTREERARVARLTIEHAGNVPVIVGIGALRTEHVLALAAQSTGAAGVLLAPMTYQELTPDDVYGLYEDVTAELSVPLVVYDNPGTTHVTSTDHFYATIATLPHVASFTIPGVPADPAEARAASRTSMASCQRGWAWASPAMGSVHPRDCGRAVMPGTPSSPARFRRRRSRSHELRGRGMCRRVSDRAMHSSPCGISSRPTEVCEWWNRSLNSWGSRHARACPFRCADSSTYSTLWWQLPSTMTERRAL